MFSSNYFGISAMITNTSINNLDIKGSNFLSEVRPKHEDDFTTQFYIYISKNDKNTNTLQRLMQHE